MIPINKEKAVNENLTAKGDFLDAVWHVVNWADVAERLAATRRLDA